MKEYDLVVVGGGSAGLAAAITAYEEGIRSILLLEKEKYLNKLKDHSLINGLSYTFKRSVLKL